MVSAKPLTPKSDDVGAYFDTLATQDAQRAKHLEKLAQDTTDLIGNRLLQWTASPELHETRAAESINLSSKNERTRQALLSLPNPYGWMDAEYPDDMSNYPAFGAPFNVETPRDFVDGGQAEAGLAGQQLPASFTQNAKLRSAPGPPRILAVSKPNSDAAVDKSSIPGACGPEVAANLVTFDVTAEEVLTFFARHYRWLGYMDRFIKNGWNVQSIANYINWTRDLKGAKVFRTPNLTAAIRLHDVKVGTEDRPGESRLSLDHWVANHQRALMDISLADLAKRIVNWPAGHGCGPLTRCIQYAIAHPEQKIMLSDADRIVHEQGFQLLLRKRAENPDVAARHRFDASGNNVQRDHRV